MAMLSPMFFRRVGLRTVQYAAASLRQAFRKDSGGRLLRWLERADLFLYLAPAFMIVLLWGTLAQQHLSPYQAQAQYFESFILWGGGTIPLPGGATLLALMLVGLAVKLMRPAAWLWPKTGVALAHAGALLLLAAGAMVSVWKQEGSLTLDFQVPTNVYQETKGGQLGASLSLPFSLTLLHAKQNNYPGVNVPSSYASRVLVRDGPTSWEATLRMNDPLRYRGYVFYQTVFLGQDAADGLVLTVVKNQGWQLPYLAGFLLSLGILLSLFASSKHKRKRERP
jgi:hypothetical protein